MESDLKNRLEQLYSNIAEAAPLIHCITNPISINDCANILLAIGARPIMAEHPSEVAEITATSKALALNLGNITDARLESMLIAGRKAKEMGIPVVIDLVGTACSSMRLGYARSFIDEIRPEVIKGNVSELRAVCSLETVQNGIDASEAELVNKENKAVYSGVFGGYAKAHGVTILASGPIDLITDGNTSYFVANGTPALSRVTGTGCMLNVLTGAALSAIKSIEQASPSDACLLACLVLEISGEKAEPVLRNKGAGSYHTALLDEVSLISAEELIDKAILL